MCIVAVNSSQIKSIMKNVRVACDLQVYAIYRLHVQEMYNENKIAANDNILQVS